jgi:hypothetical protein
MYLQERAPMYMPHLPAFLSGRPIPGMEAPIKEGGAAASGDVGSNKAGSSSSKRSALLHEIQQYVCDLKQVRYSQLQTTSSLYSCTFQLRRQIQEPNLQTDKVHAI